MLSWRIKAPAKVNLFLHIVGKRQDNKHLIESLFVFVKVYDLLEVALNTNKSVIYFHKYDQINKYHNTVQRVVDLVKQYIGYDFNLSIRVIKNILISAGLGGGSVDAAAMLRLLGRIWNINEDILKNIAGKVGADIPACLESKPLFVTGIGENLYRLSSFYCPRYIILVNSQSKPVSTAEVFYYHKQDSFSQSVVNKFSIIDSQDSWLDVIFNSKNDLFYTALKICPEIENVLSVLKKLDGCLLARMTGSGGTCFALFKYLNKAKLAYDFINNNHPTWWIKNTEIIF